MSKYSTTFTYHLKTQLEKSGITNLQNSLKQVETHIASLGKKGQSINFTRATASAQALGRAFQNAFNMKTGALNFKQLNTELAATNQSMRQHYNNLSKAGTVGKNAFYNSLTQLSNFNTGVKQSNVLLDKMFTTMMNTVRWGITAMMFQQFISNVRKAISYVNDLDTALNDIRIVTGQSTGQMEKFAKAANQAAKALGTSTKEYAEAALIFYQQGLGDQEVKERTDVTATVANITGQDAAEVSAQLTAIWNGYQATGDQLQALADKSAAVAASTAADLEEIATATGKVASVAHMTGLSFDSLNAMIATAVSVTKQAPESVGVAFKTVLARMTDLRAEGKVSAENAEDFAVSLGEISGNLSKMGINILDENQHLKSTNEIITQVGDSWSRLGEEQQVAIAQAMAGKRQWNILASVFENWDMYNQSLIVSQEAVGTTAEQNAIYLQSTAAKLEILKAKNEALYSTMFQTDNLQDFIGFAGGLSDIFNHLFASIDGAINGVVGALSLIAVAFSASFGRTFQGFVQNFLVFLNGKQQLNAIAEISKTLGTSFSNLGKNSVKELVDHFQRIAPLIKLANQEERELFHTLQLQTAELLTQKDKIRDRGTRLVEDARTKMGFTSSLENKTIAGSKGVMPQAGNEGFKINAAGFLEIQQGTDANNLYAKSLEGIRQGGILVAESHSKLSDTFKQYKQQIKEGADSTKTFKAAQQSMRGEIEALLKQHNIFGPYRKGLQDVLSLLNKASSKQGLEVAMRNLSNLSREMIAESPRLKAALEDFAIQSKQKVQELNSELKLIRTNIQQLETSLKSRQIYAGFSSLAGGIGQAAFALQSLLTLFDTFSDPDLSGFEKTLRFLTTMMFVLPGLLTSFKALNSGIASIMGVGAEKAQLDALRANETEHIKDIGQHERHIKDIENVLTEEQIKDERAAARAALEAEAAAGEEGIDTAGQEVRQKDDAAHHMDMNAKEALAQEARQADEAGHNKMMIGERAAAEKASSASSAGAAGAAGAAVPATKSGGALGGVAAVASAHPVIAAIVGVALVAVLAAGIIGKIKEKEREENKAAYDLASKQYDQFKQFSENYEKEYQALVAADNAMADTATNKVNLLKITQDITAATGDESYELQALAGNYKEVARSIKEAKDEQLAFKAAFAGENVEAIVKENKSKIPDNEVQRRQHESKRQAFVDDKNTAENNMRNNPYDKSLAETYNEAIKALEEFDAAEEKSAERRKLTFAEAAKELEEINKQRMAVQNNDTENIDYGLPTEPSKLRELQQERLTYLTEIQPQVKENVEAYIDNELNLLGDSLDTLTLKKIEEQAARIADEANAVGQELIGANQALALTYTKIAENSNDPEKQKEYFAQAQMYEMDIGADQQEDYVEKYGLDKIRTALEQAGGDVDSFILLLEELDDTEVEVKIKTEQIDESKAKLASFNKAMQEMLEGDDLSEDSIRFLEQYKEELEGLEGYAKMSALAKLQIQEAELSLERAKAAGDTREIARAELELAQARANQANIIVVAQDKAIAAQEALTAAIDEFGEGSLQADYAALVLKDSIYSLEEATIAADMAAIGYNGSLAAAVESLKAVDSAAKAVDFSSLEAKWGSLAGAAWENARASAVALIVAQNVNNAAAVGPHGAQELIIPEDIIGRIAAAADASLSSALSKLGSVSSSLDKRKSATAKDSSAGSEGSSSDAKKELEDLVPDLKDIYDQYKTINNEIQKYANALNRLAVVQDKLIGQDLIDNLNQQAAILREQVKSIEERLTLEKEELATLREELSKKGITFDATGSISNYDEKFKTIKEGLEAAAETYNKNKTDANKEAYEKLQEEYEALASLIERYDELNIDIIFQTETEILEKQLELIEKNIQKMDIELEVTLDTNEAIRKWNEFEAIVLNGLDLEDPLTAITNTVKNLSSYWNGTDGSLDVLSKQIAGLNAEIAIMEAGGESSQYGSGETGISAATEVLKDRMDQYIELSLEYDEIVKSIKENTLSWIDATADGFNEINSQFEYVSSELEHHANVIKLIYGEEAYEQMEGYYEAQRANNSASIRALKSQVDNLTALREALGQPGDENFDQELYDRYTSQIQDFQGELNSAIEESLQLLADEYSNSVSSILSNFAKGLSGGLGLPEIEKEWKRINEEADLYLDKTSASFKITKLQSQYMDAINKADSTQVKQHLNEIMNRELELLREKDELTQGDLERATKRLDIELKKIALEEAQRNKSTMKLQRDAQGNYSYVYTADEGAISKAAEELEAAQEEFYESSRNSLKENKDQFLSLFSEYQSELAEARTPEEIEKVNESFRKRFEAVLSENTSITDALKKFYADEYGEGTAEYEAAVGGLDDTVQNMIDSLIGAGGFGAASEDLKTLLLEAFGDYQEGIEGVEEDSGRDFDSINASMAEAVAYTQELVDKNEELINKMWDEAEAIRAATAAWREYDAATAHLRTSGNASAGTASGTTASPTGGYTGVNDTGGATVPNLPGYTDTGRDEVPTLPGDPATPTLPGDPAGDASEGAKAAEALAKDWIGTPYKMGGDSKKGVDCSHFAWRVANATGVRHPYAYTGAIKPSESYPSGKGKYVSLGWSKPGEVRGSKYGHAVIQVNGVQYESSGSKGVHANGTFKPNYWIHPKGFDTGGYTGEWSGADGKLAFLHQKEIVLKEGDTANLLLAVSAVRDLVGKIKTNTMLSQQDALLRTGIMPNIGAPAVAAGTSQQIQINADFPSVKDAEEIKKAFNNLINSAAQYANRKK